MADPHAQARHFFLNAAESRGSNCPCSDGTALLVFVGIFLLWSFLAVLGSWGAHQAYSEIPAITGLVTAFVSLVAITATLVSAGRADRRIAKESERKLYHLQQHRRVDT
jgi:hypothetical protein